MNKAANLQNLVVESKVEEDELEQVFSIVHDGGNIVGAISNLAKKAGVKPEDISQLFKKKFGKSPDEMKAQLKKKDEYR